MNPFSYIYASAKTEVKVIKLLFFTFFRLANLPQTRVLINVENVNMID